MPLLAKEMGRRFGPLWSWMLSERVLTWRVSCGSLGKAAVFGEVARVGEEKDSPPDLSITQNPLC